MFYHCIYHYLALAFSLSVTMEVAHDSFLYEQETGDVSLQVELDTS